MHSLMIRIDRTPSADANPTDELEAWIEHAARGDRQAFERLLDQSFSSNSEETNE